MNNSGLLTLLLIVINIIISYQGFTREGFMEKYQFQVDSILVQKQYYRFITSGFLHVNWSHLIFNMMSLYFFGEAVESYLGPLEFSLVYFASLIAGDLFALLVHKNHGDYCAVGASGAVCGVIFASVALFPGMGISVFFLHLPGWLYGILFVAITILGIRSKKDNIGHEAHLGGALCGMLLALLLHPYAFKENYITILLIAVPSVVFIYLIISRPHFLLIAGLSRSSNPGHYSIDHQYNAARTLQQQEIDAILEKISKRGMKSLTKKEKEQLDEYSKKLK
ncbi:MAG: rhomboid family intramembrane serine protease [Bacteroidetes bacterium]|nr:rhomboid family intramembrane serine protease [Bacteroidota bacterium]